MLNGRSLWFALNCATLIALSNVAAADDFDLRPEISLCEEPSAIFEVWRSQFQAIGWRAPTEEEIKPAALNMAISAYARAGLRDWHWEYVNYWLTNLISRYRENDTLDLLVHDRIKGVAIEIRKSENTHLPEGQNYSCQIVADAPLQWTVSLDAEPYRVTEHGSYTYIVSGREYSVVLQNLDNVRINEFLSSNMTAVQAIYTSKTLTAPEA